MFKKINFYASKVKKILTRDKNVFARIIYFPVEPTVHQLHLT